MAELPITFPNLQRTPGLDGFRWRVGVAVEDDEAMIVVEVSDTTAVTVGLSRSELQEQLPRALQSYSASRLRNDLPVMEQVVAWDSPVVLRPDHLEP
jgi:hypothetical protein